MGTQNLWLRFLHELGLGLGSEYKKEISRTRVKEAHTAGAYPGFCSMKQLRVLLLPPGRDASSSKGYPQQYVAGTHLYTWVERDNVG